MKSGARRLRGATSRAYRRLIARLRTVDLRVSTPLFVLRYHRVATTSVDPWELSVDPVRFDEQLSVLAQLADLEHIDRVLHLHRRRNRGKRPTAVITFDDGYADNLHRALPLLEHHDAPATVFVATRFLDRPAFWWDQLAAIFHDERHSVAELAGACRTIGVTAARDDDRDALHDSAYERLVWHAPDDIDELLGTMSATLETVTLQPDGRPLTTDELLRLAAHPLITIGAHTHDHRRLGGLDTTAMVEELVAGRQALDAALGAASRPLAYPYGDAPRAAARAARRAGFRHAFTTRPGLVSAFDSALLLPRLHPHDVGGDDFRAWLARAAPSVVLAQRARHAASR